MNWFLLFLVILPSVSALSGKLPLLALTELSNGTELGSATELMVDVRQGSERVFLETIPFTKISTQMSLRFAQQIACHEFELNCNDKDFFFAIKALPGPIVGGPSAGAAAAILVSAVLQNQTLDPMVAMTGTINSGGLIGPVGGIDKKIQAAAEKGFRTVLIPAGSRFQKNPFFDNTSDLVALGARWNVTVQEVATLREAYGVFTGVKIAETNASLYVEPEYGALMKSVAMELCTRTSLLAGRIPVNNDSRTELVQNLTIRASEALDVNASYSAASFCFRGNIVAKDLINTYGLSGSNFSVDVARVKSQLAYVEDVLAHAGVETLTGLQAFIAVRDRVLDAQEGVEEAEKEKDLAVQRRLLSFAEERVVSARAWSRFFELSGRDSARITDETMKKACVGKVSEAEERYHYVKSVLPASLRETRRTLDRAYVEYQNLSFASCIGSASKAKAEADVVMGLLGVDDERLDEVLAVKLGLVRRQLLRAQEDGVFPIVGYSYYEYAQSLAPVDVSSALLFSEYALELSDLGLYFGKPQTAVKVRVNIDLLSLGVGAILGILLTGIYYTVAYRRVLRKFRKK